MGVLLLLMVEDWGLANKSAGNWAFDGVGV